MIDSLVNLLFRCPHRRLTRPMTPVSKAGVPHGDPYVVCLDCGKQFDYDLKNMRIGKPVETSHASCVVPPKTPLPRRAKVKYALLASVPVAVLIGSALRAKKNAAGGRAGAAGKLSAPDKPTAGDADPGAGI